MPISNPPTPPSVPTILTGTYTGDASDGRQITTGFKCSRVIIMETTNVRRCMMIPTCSMMDIGSSAITVVTARQYLHATDGFVVSQATDFMNATAQIFRYWAIGE